MPHSWGLKKSKMILVFRLYILYIGTYITFAVQSILKRNDDWWWKWSFYVSAVFKEDVVENKPAVFSRLPKNGEVVNGLRPGYEYEYKVRKNLFRIELLYYSNSSTESQCSKNGKTVQ